MITMPDDNRIDSAFITKLGGVIKVAEKYFQQNDYTGALITIEQAFWDFTDNYLEIVKGRAYAGEESALKSLYYCLKTFCGLFAPFMPFITEEVWQAHPWNNNGKSIHNMLFPSLWGDFAYDDLYGEPAEYDLLCELVSFVRGQKSAANKSMKAPIAKLTVRKTLMLSHAEQDIKNVLNVTELEFSGEELVGELVWGE